jgi:CPA2 family monovalent cation:H+ antiporter-2
LLTTALVAVLLWLAGQPPVLAFVVGAVFAQSSSTIIGRQLAEQGEDATAHGRLGLAMSVFQDVTAVPFVILIPARRRHRHGQLAGELGWAAAKAVLAFTLVFYAARWALRPLFHLVAERRSAEPFTLTVLLVVLLAAWTTHSLGLSLAFGAFLAGMMLGETEFRHQVESSIRPFRDVLLGLFFVGIGMLIEPAVLPRIWHWALLGALLLLLSKILVVVLIVRRSGMESVAAWQTALLLAVGGEFGFALLAIALDASVLDPQAGQIVLNAVLFSLIGGVLLIRYNQAIASRLARPSGELPPLTEQLAGLPARAC